MVALREGIEHPYIKKCTLPILPQTLFATMSSFAPSSLFALLCASCSSASGCKLGSVLTLWRIAQDIILTSLTHKSSYSSELLSSSISYLILTPQTHVVTISNAPVAIVYLINRFLSDPHRNLCHLHLTNLVHSHFIYSHLVTYTRFVYCKC